MSLWKIAQDVPQAIFLFKLINRVTSVIFENKFEVNNRPRGENSPNPVTLTTMLPVMGLEDGYFLFVSMHIFVGTDWLKQEVKNRSTYCAEALS
jgi:hypothetical protein